MTETLTENGLPVEAQPWARKVERFIRDEEVRRQQLAGNTESAIVASGNAVVAAANSVQAQLAAQYEMTRIPATLLASDITVTPSTYFDSTGTPHGRFDVSVIPSDLDLDGNPLIPTAYQVWARVFFVDPGIPVSDKTTMGYGPAYHMLGTNPGTNIQVNGLQVGVEYQIRVAAVSSFGVSSILSDYVAVTTPATLDVMVAPSAPTLSTGAGMLIASWDGLFGGALPPSQFRYTYADVSVAGAASWVRMGSALVRGGGSIQISGLIVGTDYDVRLIAIDSLNAETAASTTSTITLLGVDISGLAPDVITVISAGGTTLTWADTAPTADGTSTGDIWFQHDAGNSIIAQWQWLNAGWLQQSISHEVISSIDLGTATVGTLDGGLITANTIGADRIVAGSLTVNQLSPTVGDDLNLSANGAVTIIAGKIDTVTTASQATKDSLDEMQTYYSFGADGATISSPASPFQLALRADKIEMLENGATVSYWNSGQMFVRSFVGNEVVLGNHKLEKLGTGTVVRAL